MTHEEFRAKLAELTSTYRAAVAVLRAEYTNPAARAAANAAKAANARSARERYARERGAYEFLELWRTNPDSFRNGVWLGEGSATDLVEAKLACDLRPLQYAYREISPTRYEVTKIGTM